MVGIKEAGHPVVDTMGIQMWIPWASRCGHHGHPDVDTMGIQLWTPWASRCGPSQADTGYTRARDSMWLS